MDFSTIFSLNGGQWISMIACSILIGFSKTGLSSAIILAVPILAAVFGGKDSTGIMLPLLIVGDLFAVAYYTRHAEWKEISRLMPWNVCGLVMGTLVGNSINDSEFKLLIASSVLICSGILVYSELKNGKINMPRNVILYTFLGILCGFTSMIGNAAGPIFSVYLLARGFNKLDFMGTTAWFFLINNLFKVPLQVFIWHNITLNPLLLTGAMLPAIALGAVLGSVVLKKIPETFFRYLLTGMTALAAFRLLI